MLWSELDWIINRDTHCIEIHPWYTDNINFIRSWYPKIHQAKRLIPKMLSTKWLVVNISKAGEFEICRNSNQRWKEWKVPGRLLDTEQDIKRGRGLAAATCNKFENIFKSHSTSQDIKLKFFSSYAVSIFTIDFTVESYSLKCGRLKLA